MLSRWEYSTRAETFVRAPAERALAAVREVTFAEVPLTAALLLARALPGLLKRRFRLPSRSAPLLELLTSTPGFLDLPMPPGLLAGGYVGRPWRLTGGARRVQGAEAFASFREPGYAKVTVHFEATPERSGSRIVTETRIHLTDEQARRAFGRYWTVVRPGSDLIRKDWLRAARRRAEKNI